VQIAKTAVDYGHVDELGQVSGCDAAETPAIDTYLSFYTNIVAQVA